MNDVSTNMNPNYDWIHYGAGMVYMKKRRYKEAEEKFNALLAINPSDGNAYTQLGLTNKIKGSKEEAGLFFKKAIDTGFGNVAVHFQLGLLHMEEGRHDAAMNCFSEALQQNPDHINAILNLANIHTRQADYDRARALLEKIDNKNAVTPDQLVKLLPCLINAEQFDMAIRLLNPAIIKEQEGGGPSLITLLLIIGVVEITSVFAERLVGTWEAFSDQVAVRLSKLLAERSGFLTGKHTPSGFLSMLSVWM